MFCKPEIGCRFSPARLWQAIHRLRHRILLDFRATVEARGYTIAVAPLFNLSFSHISKRWDWEGESVDVEHHS